MRHDLRHPFATISMIASTMAAFGDDIDMGTVGSYLEQIQVERSRLGELVVTAQIDLTALDQAVQAFCDEPSSREAALNLDRIAQQLIGLISSQDAS